MHAIWSIAELVELIVAHCLDSELSALAQSSRSPKDPALNKLWAHAKTSRLFKLIPSDLDAEITPADVAVLSDYARRVIHLKLDSPLRMSAVEALSQHASKPICPNVHVLSATIFGALECDLIPQLLGPKVHTIKLHCVVTPSQSTVSLLSYVGRCHPSLKVFKVSLDASFRGDPSIEDAIGATISQLHALAHIRVTHLNDVAMVHIAASKTIHTLDIYIRTRDVIQPVLAGGPNQFTNLSNLTLQLFDDDVLTVHQLISTIQPSRLQSFALYLPIHSTPGNQWQMFLHHLAQRHSSTMQSLFIYDQSYADYPPCSAHLFLEPLLVMRNLTAINLCRVRVTLDNEELTLMASTWPNLRKLIFTPVESGITLSDFASLVNNLQKLEAIQISLDARVTSCEFLDTFVESGSCNRNLTRMAVVSPSPIEDPMEVVKVLSKIAPGLHPIHLGEWNSRIPDAIRYHGMWEDVRKEMWAL